MNTLERRYLLSMDENGINTVRRRSAFYGYLGVFAAALLLYVGTCAPGPVWQDSGVIQYRVLMNDIEGPFGLALSHPLYYLIAIGAKYALFMFGEPAYRVNLTTAVIAALAVANLFLLIRLWTGRVFAGIVAAGSLALSHTFWRHAAIPETYCLTVALLLAELIVLLQYAKSGRVRYLYLLAFLSGLSVANHMLGSIALVCYLVLVGVLLAKKAVRVRDVVIGAILWVVGAFPLEYLFVRELIESGDLGATLASAAFGDSWQGAVLNASISGRIVKENVLWILLNFPTLNLILAFVGGAVVCRLAPVRWFGRIVMALLVLYLLFAFRYTVVDRYAFFIPFYTMVAVLIGLGTHVVVEKKRCLILCGIILVLIPVTVPVYIAAPGVARRMEVAQRQRVVPYRDDYEYLLQPWKTGYRGARRFAYEALSTVEPNGVLYADSTTAPPLLYIQEVEGMRPDVSLVAHIAETYKLPQFASDTITDLVATRAVYVVSPVEGYCPDYLLRNDEFDFLDEGVIWRIVPQGQTASGLCADGSGG